MVSPGMTAVTPGEAGLRSGEMKSSNSKLPRSWPKLRCPACGGDSLYPQAQGLTCKACTRRYPRVGGVQTLLPWRCRGADGSDPLKERIAAYWGGGYEKLFADQDRHLTKRDLRNALASLGGYFLWRRHMASVEVDLRQLDGERVLDIGCGPGTHSALFAYHGARPVAIDLALPRARAAARKFRVLGAWGQAFQADAESLPFEDGQFDIVFSNGVLHHTPNTDKAIAETYRVLKPGGHAAIMLYARHSTEHWVHNVLYQGIWKGEWRRHGPKAWLGAVTERDQAVRPEDATPVTKVYSKSDVRKMFARFSRVSIRKYAFNWEQDPILLSRLYRRVLSKIPLPLFQREEAEVTKFLYGNPVQRESPLELTLGKYLGFALAIRACKPR